MNDLFLCHAERDIIAAEVAALRSDQPEAIKEAALPALLSGVAAHHAGCLPAWKALVERLFQRGELVHKGMFPSVLSSREVLSLGVFPSSSLCVVC